MLQTWKRWLQVALVLIGFGLAANAVLGPLLLGVIEYHYGASMTNQGIGLDAVALVVVAPIALFAALLVRREHVAGPVLAFVPATFAAYMAPQYVVGLDYLRLPGNNEQFFLLHLTLLVAGIAALLLAWQGVDRVHLLPADRRSDLRRSWVLAGAAAFVVLRWLPELPGLVDGDPTSPAFNDNPTAFMLIAVLDLALVVPAAVTAVMGLRSGAVWARAAAYGVLGFFAAVPLSVAAMAVTMLLRGDPHADAGEALVLSFAAVLFTSGAALLYAPLRRTPPTTVPADWVRAHRHDV